MKKRIVSLFLALMLLSTLVLPVWAVEIDLTEDGDTVYDEYGILTDSEEEEIAELLEEVGDTYDVELVVVFLPEISGDSAEYAEDLYDTMGFGYGSGHDGVLLMVSFSPREYQILVNGYAAEAIGVYAHENIIRNVGACLSDRDYADACRVFARECDYYLDAHVNGFATEATQSTAKRDRGEFSAVSTLLSSLVIGFVAGIIVVIILAGQLKSVKKQYQAKDYVRHGSMHLTQRSDTFLYRNVSRVKRDSGSSSSGSRSRSSSRSGSRSRSSSRSSSRRVGGGKF